MESIGHSSPMATMSEELPPLYEFEAPPVLYKFKTPRFGYRDDFPALFNDEAQQDYLIGLSILGVMVVGIFLLWGILLLVFCCLGRKVGFMSGNEFEKIVQYGEKRDDVVEHIDYDDTHAADEVIDEEERQRRAANFACHGCCGGRPTRVRLVFLLSGALFVSSAALMVIYGIANLRQTVGSLEFSVQRVHDVANGAYVLLEDTKERVGGIAEQLRISVRDELDQGKFCPANPILKDSENGQQIEQQAGQVVDALEQVRNFIAETSNKLSATLQNARDTAAESVYYLQEIQAATNDWRVMLSMIPTMVVPVLLMAGAAMALFEVSFPAYTCVINWFLMPLFVIIVALNWAVAGGMIIAAGATGDFCLPGGRINSPDTTIRQSMEELGLSQEAVFFIIDYYLRQCRGVSDPFTFIRDEIPKLEAGAATATELETLLDQGNVLNELSLYCNRDFAEFKSLVGDMVNVIVTLLAAAGRALELVSCGMIVPLYIGLAYEGMCTYSASAVMWVFGTAMVMAVTGMIMITLRSSFKMTRFFVRDSALHPNETKDTVNPLVDDADVVVEEVEPER